MAERFTFLEKLLKDAGYTCDRAYHPTMSQYSVLHSKTGNIRFGFGILDGRLAIVRYSHLDGNNGTTAVLSSTADISLVTFSIELLAKGALNALQAKANVSVA